MLKDIFSRKEQPSMSPFVCSRTPVFNVLPALILMALATFGAPAHAQAEVIMRCGVEHEHDVLPDPFPGVYYREAINYTDPDWTYRFEKISSQGVVILESPFTAQQSQSMVWPRVSPDGRFMVFRPAPGNTDLTLWDMQTDEVATLPLTENELGRLERKRGQSYDQRWNKLVWLDAQTLQMNYFVDLSYEYINATQTINITQNPLQLSRDVLVDIVFPDFSITPDAYPSYNLSPQGTYTSIIFREIVPGLGSEYRLSIYHNASSMLVFDLMPDSVQRVELSHPIWMPDEQTFFQGIQIDTGTVFRWKLSQFDNNQGFQENPQLPQALENAFGSRLGLGTFFLPMLSNDEQTIAFHMRSQADNTDYALTYTPASGEILAVCFSEEWRNTKAFWVPGDRYFGYATTSAYVKVFDRETGDVYTLTNTSGFIGWIQDE